MGTAAADKLPLEMLLQRITTDLFLVFAGNGYKKIGFTLIAQELDGEEQMGMAGNLRPDGLRAILTNAIESLPPEGPMVLERPN